jgi:hypothetical protein
MSDNRRQPTSTGLMQVCGTRGIHSVVEKRCRTRLSLGHRQILLTSRGFKLSGGAGAAPSRDGPVPRPSTILMPWPLVYAWTPDCISRRYTVNLYLSRALSRWRICTAAYPFSASQRPLRRMSVSAASRRSLDDGWHAHQWRSIDPRDAARQARSPATHTARGRSHGRHRFCPRPKSPAAVWESPRPRPAPPPVRRPSGMGHTTIHRQALPILHQRLPLLREFGLLTCRLIGHAGLGRRGRGVGGVGASIPAKLNTGSSGDIAGGAESLR